MLHPPYKRRYLWFNPNLPCAARKGGANVLRALLILPKVQRENYEVSLMGRFIQNLILWNMWNKNDIKSSQTTNGDYS